MVLVGLATALMAVSYLDRQVLAILAPTITAELSISEATYGLLAGAFSIAYLIAPPFAGRMLDTVGVRRGLPLAVLVWSCVAAAHAGVLGVVSLFALRFALGLAESPSFPGAARVVRESVSPAASARAFGFLFTGSSLGAIIAPPLATTMAATLGWRFTFVGTAIVGLLWIPAWWLASSREPAKTKLDAARATESAASPRFVEALRQPPMWRSIAATLAASPVAAFGLLWGAKLLVGRFGMPQKDVGTLLWMPPLFFDAGAIVFGDMASRMRARARANVRSGPSSTWPVRVLFALAGALCACIALIAYAQSALGAVLLTGVALMGVGGVSAIHTSENLSRVPRELVGVCAGVAAAAQSLAYIVAAAIIGRVVGGSGGYGAVVMGLGAWAIPGAILWCVWPERLAGPRLLRARAEAIAD